MRNWTDGIIRDVYDLSDYKSRWGYNYYMFHRINLHEQLQLTAKTLGANIIVDHKAVDVNFVEGIVTFDTGTSTRADIIIGADGVRSYVRELIGIVPQTKPCTSTCYRCVIPTSRVKQFGLKDFASDNAIQFWGGFGIDKIVLTSCSDGEIAAFYCFYPAEHNDRSEEGWNFSATSSMLRAPYPDLDPDLLAIFEHVEDIKLWKLVVHEPYPYWVKDRVVLLGDAAHPMLPDQSQGSCMAIEDAAALALIFSPEHWGKTVHTVEHGLQLYEQMRKPRATRVQEASARARENLNERIGWSSKQGNDNLENKTTKLTIDEINAYDMNDHLNTLINEHLLVDQSH
jgi:salicylate hydroxylase